METIYMNAGLIATIVLCIVGLLKLPFKTFKAKHPIGYKAVFTSLSIVLCIGLAVLDEIFIIGGELLSFNFIALVCAVFAGVSTSYISYEGLGVKDLVKKINTSIKTAKVQANDKKVVEFLNNIEDIDKAIKILIERKNGGV